MPDTMTCPNAACGATIGVAGREIGDTVTCPKCGQEARVLAEVGRELDIELLTPEDVADGHPARLKCTVCGAVLGVRDATCPKCGGDIRSGVTHIRITEEDKRRHGLFFRRSKGAGGRRRRSGARVLVGLTFVLILAVAGLAAAVTLRKRDPALIQPPPERRVPRPPRRIPASGVRQDTAMQSSQLRTAPSPRSGARQRQATPGTATGTEP